VINTNIQSGLTYNLRYRAHNVQGWGDYSPVVSILAATAPSQAQQPETTIVDTDIKISWSAPTSTGGVNVVISNYYVEILLEDGSFIEACSVTELYCLLPIESLLEEPFNFVQGDEVQARVTAFNSLGQGLVSLTSSVVVTEV
jgi:hypothetical protein